MRLMFKKQAYNKTKGRSLQTRIKVAELFAGVGGFRIGLDQASSPHAKYETIWSNQWEPTTQKQHASEVYVSIFGKEGHSCKDIAKVATKDVPDHDLLVGGFPCQDYSVARTLSQAAGLQGKKGVLWWEIYRILNEKGTRSPKFLMLENVDRLLKSPSKQRGRDFAIMLSSLSDLGYIVEWRVINAADYGMPQRRRRIYILGYKQSSTLHKEAATTDAREWLTKKGTFAKAFPVQNSSRAVNFLELGNDTISLSDSFNLNKSDAKSPFYNAGIMIKGQVWTLEVKPDYRGKRIVLRDIVLLDDREVDNRYFVSQDDLETWKYLKGAKKESRKGKDGFSYTYTEGPVSFPDMLDKPSRTIVTGEGGPTPSRFKHVIMTKSGRYRRLMPFELELLNMFPRDHTKLDGISDVKRAFFMGNALVVGVIERIGKELLKRAFNKTITPTKLTRIKKL